MKRYNVKAILEIKYLDGTSEVKGYNNTFIYESEQMTKYDAVMSATKDMINNTKTDKEVLYINPAKVIAVREFKK